MTATTESTDENFVIFINEIEATIARNERRNFLAILDQLDTAALANGRVRLLGFDTDFLDDNSLGVGRATERIALVFGAEVGFLVIFVSPQLGTTSDNKLTGAPNSARFASGHCDEF